MKTKFKEPQARLQCTQCRHKTSALPEKPHQQQAEVNTYPNNQKSHATITRINQQASWKELRVPETILEVFVRKGVYKPLWGYNKCQAMLSTGQPIIMYHNNNNVYTCTSNTVDKEFTGRNKSLLRYMVYQCFTGVCKGLRGYTRIFRVYRGMYGIGIRISGWLQFAPHPHPHQPKQSERTVAL